MSREESYTEQEKLEWIEVFGRELRDGDVSEEGFRRKLASFGYNATDIDQIVNEAMRPT